MTDSSDPNSASTDTHQQDLTGGSDRYPDVISRRRPGQVADVKKNKQQVVFTTENRMELIVNLVRPEIFQLTYYLEGDLRSDFSYAVDPDFPPQKVNFSLKEYDEYYQITTNKLICKITRKKLLVDFYDTKGNILCEDEHGFYRRDSLMKGISEIKVTKKAPKDVRYFGLGDKAVDSNLRGRAYVNWNTDSYAYKRGDDPLYRSVPFYMAMIDSRAYGIFLDNTYRTRFSFDRKKNRVSSFTAQGGVMNYYFIYGPELTSVAERYTRLTGTPELPPMWALGYHQCRWSYYPESRVRELAKTFRKKKIPCDAIYLDIDYMDGYRCFTWDDELFPNPKKMIKALKEQGFQTIVMVDPGIKADINYHVYKEGTEKGYFCRRPDGDLIIAPVWPPRCAFPDYTDPKVREWWAGLYDEFMSGVKISGIWNDMNEPAVFEVQRKTFPNDIRHDFDGHPCSHKKAHNIYGMLMASASLEGIKKHVPDKRPFLLTRANFSGGQRYAAVWTGDNIASWDHLRLANEQSQRLSISGFSFTGSDIGGFVEKPSPELFARWLQLGIFHPLFRNHTMGYNVDGAAAVKKEQVEDKKAETTSDQEPWVFGKKFTDINRKIIELRYRLLSYLYTAFQKYVEKGTPVIRPLAYYDQSDEKALSQNDPFLFGGQIIVVPVLEKGATSVAAYLPKGDWYHFWNHEKLEGKQSHTVDAPLHQIPFFIKAGAVLPLREVVQYAGERQPEKLRLNMYYGKKTTESRLYEDAEEGYGYKNNEYRITKFEYKFQKNTGEVRLIASREGHFEPGYSKIEITLIGLPFDATSAKVDGKEIELVKQGKGKKPLYTLTASPDFESIIIQ